MRRDRTNTSIRFPDHLLSAIDAVAKEEGTSRTRVVLDAVSQHLDDTSVQVHFENEVLRQADDIIALDRKLDVLLECLLTLGEYWFAHSPMLTAEEKKHAAGNVRTQYPAFIHGVAKTFSSSPRRLSVWELADSARE